MKEIAEGTVTKLDPDRGDVYSDDGRRDLKHGTRAN